LSVVTPFRHQQDGKFLRKLRLPFFNMEPVEPFTFSCAYPIQQPLSMQSKYDDGAKGTKTYKEQSANFSEKN